MSLVLGDCKIVQTSLHAREGEATYTARAVFEVLELATELIDEVIVGGAELYAGASTVVAAHWSADSGKTWTRTDGWSAGMYYTTSLMEASGGDVFASNGSGAVGKLGEIWRSQDRGRSWGRVFQHAANRNVTALCEAKNGNLVAVSTDEILLSTDGGASWALTDNLPAGYSGAAIIQANNGDLIMGAGKLVDRGTIFRSQDNGVNWAWVQDFLPSTGGGIPAFTKLSDGILLAGTSYLGPSRIWRSVDNGATWTRISSLVGTSSTASLTTDEDDMVYATATYKGGVFRSSDGGFTWTYSAIRPVTNSIYTVGVLSNGDLLAGSDKGSWVGRSTDKGLTWDPEYSKIKEDEAAFIILVLSQEQT